MASLAYPSLAKKAILSDGTQYGYAYVPAKPGKPTILLLHGFPSSSYDWRHQISHLPKAGYGVLAPDLLGYGDTDKPVEVEAYRYNTMGRHIVELLTLESLDKVIAVGHDFGCMLLAHLAIYHASRLQAAAFVSVGFLDISVTPNLALMNTYTKSQLGYSTSGYMEFFLRDEAAEVIEAAVDSFDSLIYPDDPEEWKRSLGPEGAAEAAIREKKIFKAGRYQTSSEREMHKKILGIGGYRAALNWYKCLLNLGPTDEDKNLTDKDKEFSLPLLYMCCNKDYAVDHERQIQSTVHRAKGAQILRVESGHWPMLEMKDEFSAHLDAWLAKL